MARTNPAQKKTEQETPQTPEPEAVVEPEVAEEKAEKVAKGPSLYHVYTTDDDGKTLNWIADKEVKTGDVAVSDLVAADQALVGKELVVVPDRNYKVYKTEVETKTKVKVTAA
jgi:hypothetical protein